MPSQIDELDEELRELLRRKADGIEPVDLQLERTMRRSNRRLARNATAIMVALGLTVGGGAAGLHAIGLGPKPKPAATPSASLLPSAGTVAARIPLTGYPVAVSVGEGAVWAVSAPRGDLRQDQLATTQDYRRYPVYSGPEDLRGTGSTTLPVGTVSRIDPATNQVSAAIEIGGVPFDAVAAYGALWVADLQQRRAIRVDASSNEATDVPLPTSVASVTAAAGSVWFTSFESDKVFRVDPTTRLVIATITVGDDGYKEIRSFGDDIWVAYQANLRLERIDPSTNTVSAEVDALVDHQSAYPEFDVGDGPVWVGSWPGPGTLQWVDPATDSIVAQTNLRWDTSVVPIGGSPDIGYFALGVSRDSVWVAATDMTATPGHATRVVGRLLRIDADTGQPVSELRIEAPGTGTSLFDVAIDSTSVWLIDKRAHELVRVDVDGGT
jgi:streptogramin lyase